MIAKSSAKYLYSRLSTHFLGALFTIITLVHVFWPLFPKAGIPLGVYITIDTEGSRRQSNYSSMEYIIPSMRARVNNNIFCICKKKQKKMQKHAFLYFSYSRLGFLYKNILFLHQILKTAQN